MYLCFDELFNMVIGELEVEWLGLDMLGESFLRYVLFEISIDLLFFCGFL